MIEATVEERDERDALDRIRFRVIDTGIGLSEDEKTHIFDSFRQADGSTTRKYGGTGLGLAISQHLAGMMGGEIGVDAEPGQGSTFWFTARLRRGETRSEPDGRILEDVAGHTAVVAVGHPTVRGALVDLLLGLGIEAVGVGDFKAALRTLSARGEGAPRWDLLLVDNTDPNDGSGLARAVRDRLGEACPPVVALTAVGSTGERGGREDFAHLIVKPVRRSTLVKAIRTALRLGREAFLPAVDVVPAPTAEEHALAGYVILIAEDNPVNRAVARGMLRGFGCEILVAENGREAVESFRENPVDLILMDWQMPEMSGLEATHEIRRLERETAVEKRTAIVALTASAMNEDRELCLAAGMDAFLSKPYKRDDLKRTIESALASAVSSVQPS